MLKGHPKMHLADDNANLERKGLSVCFTSTLSSARSPFAQQPFFQAASCVSIF
jgi:hypothetical protein